MQYPRPRLLAPCAFHRFSGSLLPSCFPALEAGKQKTTPKDPTRQLNSLKKIGAGEGIRTLDPDLGKVVLYP